MLEIDHCDQITDQAATKLVKLSKYFKVKHIFLVYSIDFTSFDIHFQYRKVYRGINQYLKYLSKVISK